MRGHLLESDLHTVLMWMRCIHNQLRAHWSCFASLWATTKVSHSKVAHHSHQKGTFGLDGEVRNSIKGHYGWPLLGSDSCSTLMTTVTSADLEWWGASPSTCYALSHIHCVWWILTAYSHILLHISLRILAYVLHILAHLSAYSCVSAAYVHCVMCAYVSAVKYTSR